LRPILFDVYPGLERVPWIELGEFPTPVEKLERFGREKGLEHLYIKRDDLSSKIYGGNKVRKLEFILADAREKRRRTLITLGAVGSNQVLATGIFGRRLGFRVEGLMMNQPNAEYVRRNLLMDKRCGIDLHYAPNTSALFLYLAFRYLAGWLRGDRPYYVPAGASSPIGNLGFVNASFELKAQVEEGLIPEPDYIIVAAGSLGTASGLELGCRLSGLKTRVVAVRVAMPWYVTAKRFASMVNRICEFMRRFSPSVPEIKLSAKEVVLLEDYLGGGYAHFTKEAMRAVEDMKKLEGIPLDGTYTGKALAGGIDWIMKRGLQDKVILFWNTYNSVDLSPLVKDVDYYSLPKPFHRYFKEPTQEELQPLQADSFNSR
jgi:D-cysteine desulfhydrase